MRIKILTAALLLFVSVTRGSGQEYEGFSLARFSDQTQKSESAQYVVQDDYRYVQRKSPLSGTALKFGWLVSPEFKMFSEWWLVGISLDTSLANILAIGIEALPYYRSDSGTGFRVTTISTFGFVNGKIGLTFSKLTVFAGGGPGIHLVYTRATIDGTADSSVSSRFTYHILGGLQLNLGSLRLFAELNMIHFEVADFRTEAWDRYLLFGIRF